MYYAQYNQMNDFETEYIFCKDHWLVLIVECLFAKASTASVARLDGRFPAQNLPKNRPKFVLSK